METLIITFIGSLIYLAGSIVYWRRNRGIGDALFVTGSILFSVSSGVDVFRNVK